MGRLLLIRCADDLSELHDSLVQMGHDVVMASSGLKGIETLRREPIDVVLCDLRLSDMRCRDVFGCIAEQNPGVPLMAVARSCTAREAIEATRFGAIDLVELPVSDTDLYRCVRAALSKIPPGRSPRTDAHREYHAAARWARAVAPVIDAPKDPRTIGDWSKAAFASPGTLRNWCRTAGITARRSLLLARLLRAAAINEEGHHRPEDLLDVVDHRTLRGLLRLAGLGTGADFPSSMGELLSRQMLVRDADTLAELHRAINDRRSAHTHGRTFAQSQKLIRLAKAR